MANIFGGNQTYPTPQLPDPNDTQSQTISPDQSNQNIATPTIQSPIAAQTSGGGYPLDPTGQPLTPERQQQLIDNGFNPSNPSDMSRLATLSKGATTPIGQRAAMEGLGAINLFGIPDSIYSNIANKPHALRDAMIRLVGGDNDPTGELRQEWENGAGLQQLATMIPSGGGTSLFSPVEIAGKTASALGDVAKFGDVAKLGDALGISTDAIKGATLLPDGSIALADGSQIGKNVVSQIAPDIVKAGTSKNAGQIIGQGIQDWGTKGNPAGAAARGAVENASISAINNIGQQNPDAAQNILLAGGMGGLAGALFSGLGKYSENATTYNQEAADRADAAVTKMAFDAGPKQIRASIANNPLSPGLSETAANQATRNMADLYRSGLISNTEIKAVMNEDSPYWKNANDVYNSKISGAQQAALNDPTGLTPNGILQQDLPRILNLPQSQDYMNYMANLGRGAEARQNIVNMIQQADATGSLQGMKNNLDAQTASLKSAIRSGDPDAYAKSLQGNAAYGIRNMAGDDALSLSNAKPGIKQFYYQSAIGRQALLHEALSPTAAFGKESSTFINKAMNTILTGGGAAVGGPAGAIAAQTLGPVVQRATNYLGNQGAAGLSSLVRPVVEGIAPAAQALQNSGTGQFLVKNAPYLATATSQVPTVINGLNGLANPQNQIQAQNPIDQTTLSPPGSKLYGYTPPNQSTSPQTTTGIPKMDQLLEAGIYKKYVSDPDNFRLFGPPDIGNPNYKDFHDGYISQLQTNGQFDLTKAAHVLLPNPDEAKIFKDYVESHLNMANEAKTANLKWIQPPSIIGQAAAQGNANRTALKKQVEALINNSAGAGVGEAADPEIDMALRGNNRGTILQALDNIMIEHSPRLQSILQKAGLR